MQIRVNREAMREAFNLARSVLVKGGQNPILHNVLAESDGNNVRLIASGDNISFCVFVRDAEIFEPGRVLLHGDRVGAILRESTDESLAIQVDGNVVVIRGDRGMLKLPTEDPGQYPVAPEPEADGCHEIDAQDLKLVIQRTAFATEPATIRMAYNGVLFELGEHTLEAVATDGRRLARASTAVQQIGDQSPEPFIVPTPALALAQKCIGKLEVPVRIRIVNNDVQFSTNDWIISSRLIQGQFPKWRPVVWASEVAEKTVIAALAGNFLSATRQAAIVTDKESRAITIAIDDDGEVAILSHDSTGGEGRIVVPAQVAGPARQAMVSYQYLSEFLATVPAEENVWVEVANDTSPVTVKTCDECTYLLMPMSRS